MSDDASGRSLFNVVKLFRSVSTTRTSVVIK